MPDGAVIQAIKQGGCNAHYTTHVFPDRCRGRAGRIRGSDRQAGRGPGRNSRRQLRRRQDNHRADPSRLLRHDDTGHGDLQRSRRRGGALRRPSEARPDPHHPPAPGPLRPGHAEGARHGEDAAGDEPRRPRHASGEPEGQGHPARQWPVDEGRQPADRRGARLQHDAGPAEIPSEGPRQRLCADRRRQAHLHRRRHRGHARDAGAEGTSSSPSCR